MDHNQPTAEAVVIYGNLCRKWFQENDKEAIKARELADMVLLSRDIFKIDPEVITNVKVVMHSMGRSGGPREKI